MATQPLDREPVPAWLMPANGFTAEEFLALTDLPRHTELIDGGLVFVAPQRNFHMAMVDLLTAELRRQVPAGMRAGREMAVRIAHRTVLEPDVLVVMAKQDTDSNLTSVVAAEVVLVVEVTSPDSEERDRDTKPHKYARAGIAHFWRVEQVDDRIVVYTYERDPTTGVYQITGIHHDQLAVDSPVPLDVDLVAEIEQYYL